jgi:glucan biosynthesis protein C
MWLTFYIYGYILFSSPQLQHAVEHKGWIGLIIGVSCLLVILFLWAKGFLGPWVERPDYSAGCLFFQVLSSLTTCSWMLVVLSFGRRFLNFSNNFLQYGGRVNLPFYLFHFPVLIVIAFFIIPWQTTIVVKFIFIASLAFLGTLATSHLFIRGMKTIGGSGRKGKKLIPEPEIARVVD